MKIGQKCKTTWQNNPNLYWVIVNLANNQATLQTPKTKREIKTSINSIILIP